MTVTNLNPPTFHAWMDGAKCASIGGDAWFPDVGGDDAVAEVRGGHAELEAFTVVEHKSTSATRALSNVYGGKTPRQRKAIRNNENERRRERRQAS